MLEKGLKIKSSKWGSPEVRRVEHSKDRVFKSSEKDITSGTKWHSKWNRKLSGG
jgi:hypothetical protein